jgi:hypothetical protein
VLVSQLPFKKNLDLADLQLRLPNLVRDLFLFFTSLGWLQFSLSSVQLTKTTSQFPEPLVQFSPSLILRSLIPVPLGFMFRSARVTLRCCIGLSWRIVLGTIRACLFCSGFPNIVILAAQVRDQQRDHGAGNDDGEQIREGLRHRRGSLGPDLPAFTLGGLCNLWFRQAPRSTVMVSGSPMGSKQMLATGTRGGPFTSWTVENDSRPWFSSRDLTCNEIRGQ